MLSLALTLFCLLAADPPQRIAPGQLCNIRLVISADNLQRLRDQPRANVPATCRVNDLPPVNVSIRLKGRGSFQPIDQKPSFTVLFHHSLPLGTRKLHLNNSAEDPTFLNEMIGTEVFHSAGLPAPRVAHANVSLNDRALGIFVLKEGFTEDFLTRHFGTPLGFLYDASEAPTDNPPQMEIDIGDPASARAKLSALTAAADETERTQRFQKLSALLDIDSFAKFLALETIICHWDGYALSENNFRLYFQPANHRFHLLPTGMDQIFSKPDLPWDAPMGGHLARAFLDTPEGAKLFRHQLESLLARSLNPPELSNRISELRTLLRPYLTGSDHLVLVRETDLLASRIHQRAASLQAQLNTTNLYAPDFVDGKALLVHWLPFDEPPGGSLSSSPSALRIVAGPKTSASWQCKVTLNPGTYSFSTGVSTREVAPLPFGTTHGASLRVLGQPQQSAPLLGSSKRPLRCEFQVTDPQQVTLVCQLRASQGEAIFDLPILLELLQNK